MQILTEILLYLVHELHGLSLHHAEGDATVPEASGPPDAVQVGLEIRLAVLIHGEAEVHHGGDLLHINPWKGGKGSSWDTLSHRIRCSSPQGRTAGLVHFGPSEGRWVSRDTSGTDVGGDEDLLLALTEALDDAGPLDHCQLGRQDGHLVPVPAHLP